MSKGSDSRRHHRPPPDAPSRRLLRRAAAPSCPAIIVTTEAGTGLVHMAPDHGEEDFLVCKAAGIDPVFAVDDDGKYRDDWLWLGGQGSVINNKFNAPDGPILRDLREAGALLAAAAISSTAIRTAGAPRPRSSSAAPRNGSSRWTNRLAPAPFRLSLSKPITSLPLKKGRPFDRLRANGACDSTGLAAIDETRWVPEKSKNRIRAMVEGRPDWVISRQRAWGVPIALYVDRKTGDYLKDPAVNSRIIRAFHEGGADAWFQADHQALLGNGYKLEDYEPVTDILDVWFDSGSTHAYVIEARYGEGVRADLYCEGSDQHRGWFQSSLARKLRHARPRALQGASSPTASRSTARAARCPRASATSSTRSPSSATTAPTSCACGSPRPIISRTSGSARRCSPPPPTPIASSATRFRYLLGALAGFTADEAVPVAEMPELERWVLHRLATLDAELKEAADGFEFNRYARARRHLRQRRPLRLLLRYPQGQPLLRRADVAEAPRLSDGARSRLPRPRALDEPDPLLHHRGGVGDALPRRRLGSPARMARGRCGLARRGAGRQMGR